MRSFALRVVPEGNCAFRLIPSGNPYLIDLPLWQRRSLVLDCELSLWKMGMSFDRL